MGLPHHDGSRSDPGVGPGVGPNVAADVAASVGAAPPLDALLRLIGHELRTPLTTAKAHAQLLHLGSAAACADPQATAGRILRALSRLEVLGEDLAAWALLEDDCFSLAPRETDLAALCRAVATAAAARCGRALELALPPDLPAPADPQRLSQAMDRLLADAFQHAPAGHPVRLRLRAVAGVAELRIEGGGPPVPADFFRCLRPAQQVRGGGLGTYLAREIVERHGGRVWAEGGPGATAFVLRLPASAAGSRPLDGCRPR